MRQNIQIFAGILLALLGALFLLQGVGVGRWPAESLMIGQRVWIARGLAIVVAGAMLVGGAALVPTRTGRKARRRRSGDREGQRL